MSGPLLMAFLGLAPPPADGPAGELMPPLQVLDAVQAGSVECGQSASYFYIGKDPAFGFGTALPFGLNSGWKIAVSASPAMQAASRSAGTPPAASKRPSHSSVPSQGICGWSQAT